MIALFEDDDFQLWIDAASAAGCAHAGGHAANHN